MSIHVALNHVTRYRYDRSVRLGPQVVRLRPAPHSRTRILSYSLVVLPVEHFINWQQDPQANYLARLTIPEPTREFRVEVDLVAEMAVLNPFDFFLEPGAEQFPFAYDETLRRELAPYLEQLLPTPRFATYLAKIARSPRPTADFLVELNQTLSQDIRYLIRMEPGVQTPDFTLESASGSCRDSAWLLVQMLRGLGLAARFVSGYLIQLTADVKALDGPSGPTHDFTDLHAWCEVYLPGAGWIGLDPTSGLLAGEGHIPLACSPEPGSAAPITGVVEPSEVEFEHTMSVSRIFETPRVTRPYRDDQWQAIVDLGDRIDADLERLDVRLTMGGEPTFVAVDDPEGAEWNTAALGPTKRQRASVVFHELKRAYAPNGLVHFGQGKWYPGEPLPRWSLNCYWREDGVPIWRNLALIADEAKDNAADAIRTGEFLRAVATRLGLDPGLVFPAYEDAAYYAWRERQLPINVDVADSRLDDALERDRLRTTFNAGLGAIVGHGLPLSHHDGAWRSGRWFLRDGTCWLVPGDSPLGYRLPLASQPWVADIDYPYINEVDPAVARAGLPVDAGVSMHATEASHERVPEAGESAHWITRTALCAQARNGTLYVFMPPLERAEHYLELVAAIEASASAVGTPLLLEGYEPPRDPRLGVFRVTPDPGVIEVNIHPASRWSELVDRTTHLYDVAHAAHLTAEKFMIDGRHTGTGGGNHFVLGGATPADSPFLRRPDLLRSLVSYWLAHPSLSYLFSGLFIGPTSQAPRIDEARNDSVYELELAFRQFTPVGTDVEPWLLDRLLRNLLIDVTG
ncbi:MAG: transglutaminase family protein, partial [Dokdonella sp.]|uniref:transglutaminase family protein n=1 Tax=Dokdonella sp. TaxID=2291710 RepID=UPI00326717EA